MNKKLTTEEFLGILKAAPKGVKRTLLPMSFPKETSVFEVISNLKRQILEGNFNPLNDWKTNLEKIKFLVEYNPELNQAFSSTELWSVADSGNYVSARNEGGFSWNYTPIYDKSARQSFADVLTNLSSICQSAPDFRYAINHQKAMTAERVRIVVEFAPKTNEGLFSFEFLNIADEEMYKLFLELKR